MQRPPRERMLIAQLSDLHIRPRGQAYGGVAQSNVQLRLVVDHLHSLDTRPDVVVVSGDLADEGSPDEHVEVATELARLSMPQHDHRDRASTADECSAAVLRGSKCLSASPVGEGSGFGHAPCPRATRRGTLPVLQATRRHRHGQGTAVPIRHAATACAGGRPVARRSPCWSRSPPWEPSAPPSHSPTPPTRVGSNVPPSRRRDALQRGSE